MILAKNILLINASPRKGGNTQIILDKFFEITGERARKEKIYLNDLNMRPCQACGGCDGGELCILDDDLKPIYEKIINADAIIFASPIYFGSISAQAKIFIDRMQPFWVAKSKFKKNLGMPKKGFLILISGASKQEFFENAKFIVKNFFMVINARYSGELFFGNLNHKGEIRDFPGLETEVSKMTEAALS